MLLSHNQLEIHVDGGLGAGELVPMATEADFDTVTDFMPQLALFTSADSDSYAYRNTATCPDCGGGMIRQGRCAACPSCGFESCMV